MTPDDPDEERILVDPSLLLTDRGELWVANRSIQDHLLISSAFYNQIFKDSVDLLSSPFLSDEDPDGYGERLARLRDVIDDGIATYSWREDGDSLGDEARSVLEVLLSSTTSGDVLADEFTFLVTHSWMVTARRYTVGAFNRAGAVVVRVGKRMGRQATSLVIDPEDLPQLIADGSLNKRAGIKWIVSTIYGGGIAAASPIPPLAIGLGVLAPWLPVIFREIDP
jgi:hypothetical protein